MAACLQALRNFLGAGEETAEGRTRAATTPIAAKLKRPLFPSIVLEIKVSLQQVLCQRNRAFGQHVDSAHGKSVSYSPLWDAFSCAVLYEAQDRSDTRAKDIFGHWAGWIGRPSAKVVPEASTLADALGGFSGKSGLFLIFWPPGALAYRMSC